jgi:hypothetical protein
MPKTAVSCRAQAQERLAQRFDAILGQTLKKKISYLFVWGSLFELQI